MPFDFTELFYKHFECKLFIGLNSYSIFSCDNPYPSWLCLF